MEPASSSSSEYDSDSSVEEIPTEKTGDEENSLSHVGQEYANNPESWNDLPSEDSCMEDEDEDEEDLGNLSLADRVYANKSNGIMRRKGSEKTKKEALALAQKRLKKMKRDKESSSSKDDKNEENEEDGERFEEKRKRSKHAPAEVSSKRRSKLGVNSSGVGVEINANRYQPQDPRMESMSGFLDPNVFEKRYAFLGDMEADEIQKLKGRISARSMTGKKGQKRRRKLGLNNVDATLQEDKEELIRLKQLHKQRSMEQIQRAAKQSVKKKLREDVAEGKRGAYYLKRSEQKKLEVEAKFEEIRKRGGKSAVSKALAKKRKKNLSKQSSLMPER